MIDPTASPAITMYLIFAIGIFATGVATYHNRLVSRPHYSRRLEEGLLRTVAFSAAIMSALMVEFVLGMTTLVFVELGHV